MTRMISRYWSLNFPLLSPLGAEAGAGREVGLVEVVQLMFLFRDLSDLPDLQYTVLHLDMDLFRTK